MSNTPSAQAQNFYGVQELRNSNITRHARAAQDFEASLRHLEAAEAAIKSAMAAIKTTKPVCQPIPNMWFIAAWPLDVFPFTPGKARTLIRDHREALVRAGAIVRPAQKLVVLGPNYLGWLQKQGDRVDSYLIAPNRKPATVSP